MSDAESQDNLKVISGIQLDRQNIRLRSQESKIISAASIRFDPDKVQIVGGDSDDHNQNPPAIIIEKKDDKIYKILVQCPCGRHAELICEYEAE